MASKSLQQTAVVLAYNEIANRYEVADRKHRVAAMLQANAAKAAHKILADVVDFETAFAIIEHAIKAYRNPEAVAARAAEVIARAQAAVDTVCRAVCPAPAAIPLRAEMSATDYLSRLAIQAEMTDCQ